MNHTAASRRLGLMLLGLACGCGGGSEIAEEKPAPSSPPVRAVQAAPKAQPAGRQRRPADDDKDERAPAAPAVKPEDLADLFDVVKDPIEPTFFIVGQEPAVKESDLFAVTLPAAGQDSSVMRFTLPGEDRTRAASGFAKLPEGFKPVPGAGASEAGLPLRIVCEKDGKTMALIPAGPSVLGTDEGPPNAGPSVIVPLDAYYIDVTEVTLGEYMAVRQAMLDARKGVLDEPLNVGDPENHPAMGVNWRDAMLYARFTGKQLPTEAQWEKAARGEAGYTYPWGDDRPIWPSARKLTQIDPVMSFPTDQSVFGVFDVSGNVREWCADWYSERGHQEASELGESELRTWEGVKRPSTPNHRVVKGNGPNWETWHREGQEMSGHVPGVGFRCVLRLDSKEEESSDPADTSPTGNRPARSEF